MRIRISALTVDYCRLILLYETDLFIMDMRSSHNGRLGMWLDPCP